MRPADTLTDHLRLMESQKAALRKLKIETVRDLLFHLPFRYEESGQEAAIAGLVPGAEATILGTLEKLQTKKSWKRRIPVSEGIIKDATGKIKVMWFNQPYIAKMWKEGTFVKAVGKITGSPGKLYLANPHLERVSPTEAGMFAPRKNSTERKNSLEKSGPRAGLYLPTGDRGSFSESFSAKLFAQYPESRGITSLWFRHAIEKVLSNSVLQQIEDPIPPELLKKYNLPTLRTALVWVHAPKELKQAEAARKRFAFEEVFLIQVERGRQRLQALRAQSFAVDTPGDAIEGFVSAFPFDATKAQHRAIDAILKDMKSGHPMSRLLEGDVGSGKTAVAATAAYAAVRTPPLGQNF